MMKELEVSQLQEEWLGFVSGEMPWLNAVDSYCNILVPFNDFLSPTQRVIRLRLFCRSGSLLCAVALCEKFSSADTALNLPCGLV